MKIAKAKLLLGILLVIVGGLALPASILIPALDAPSEEVVFQSPGQATLEIEAPGRFYLWHNFQTIHEGRKVVRDEQLPDGMTFRVTRLGDGSSVAFNARNNIHTEIGDSASRTVGYVDIETPGTFRIEVDGGDDRARVMSFARSRFLRLGGAIGISLVSMVVLGAGGIVLIIAGIAQRAGERGDQR